MALRLSVNFSENTGSYISVLLQLEPIQLSCKCTIYDVNIFDNMPTKLENNKKKNCGRYINLFHGGLTVVELLVDAVCLFNYCVHNDLHIYCL